MSVLNPNEVGAFERRPTFEPIESAHAPRVSYVDTKLEKDFKFLESEYGDLAKVLMVAYAIMTMLNSQNKNLNRDDFFKLIPEILKQTEVNASTYNSRMVWYLSAAGAVVGAGVSLYATGASLSILGSGSMQEIYNNLTPLSYTQATGNAVSQGMGTLGQLLGQYHTGIRTIGEGQVQVWILHRDQKNQRAEADLRKADEMLQMIMRILQAYHEVRMRTNGG